MSGPGRLFEDQDTICAQVTAAGEAGVAIIRVSGSQALNYSKKICSFLPEKPTSHQVYFGSFKYKNHLIDEGLVLYFGDGKSYTGEQTIEFQCHGSQIVCLEILQALQNEGCRQAGRGEFTYRAFMSGNIDLVQAEGVLSLIESTSQRAARQAIRNIKGHLSLKLKHFKKEITHVLAHLESSIDFSEEGLALFSNKEVTDILLKTLGEIKELKSSYKEGLFIKEGLKVGIFGPPNSGKSTLFNQIIGEPKAIVSQEAGTTRDLVDGDFFIKGQKIKMTDTAGLRKKTLGVEKEGLKKTLLSIQETDVALFVQDVTSPQLFFFDEKIKDNQDNVYKKIIQELLKAKDRLVFIFNKVDLKSKKIFLEEIKKTNKGFYKQIEKKTAFFISAQNGEGLEVLKNYFLKQIQGGEEALHSPRHLFCLNKTTSHLERALRNITKKESPALELVCFELKEALKNIQIILGEEVTPDVLDEIFSQFCIGK